MSDSEPIHKNRPTAPRWTHMALHVNDIEASIVWYEKYTHLRVLARNEDEDGKGVWLGDGTAAAIRQPRKLVDDALQRCIGTGPRARNRLT